MDILILLYKLQKKDSRFKRFFLNIFLRFEKEIMCMFKKHRMKGMVQMHVMHFLHACNPNPLKTSMRKAR